MYTLLKIKLINKMDQMLISGTEPSSVTLGQTQMFQMFESDAKLSNKRHNCAYITLMWNISKHETWS